MTTALPAALAGLKESAQPLASEGGSYCTFHGFQPGRSCPQCDEHFPEQVAARALASPSGIAVGYTKAEVDAMVQAAVKVAMAEKASFDAWKASPEGQAAAAVAPTAGQASPEH
jgi:hypothetical protein